MFTLEHSNCVVPISKTFIGRMFIASVTVDVFETGRKHFVVLLECIPSYHLASSPPCQLAINLITYTPVLIYFSWILIHRHGTLQLKISPHMDIST
jgi:hypothetical protein